jgi:hypothetical protein
MPLRPPGEKSARVRSKLDYVLAALDGLPAEEQLEASLLLTVTLLSAVRPRFEGSQEDRAGFDLLCDDAEEWLVREVTPLRFVRMQ